MDVYNGGREEEERLRRRRERASSKRVLFQEPLKTNLILICFLQWNGCINDEMANTGTNGLARTGSNVCALQQMAKFE